ncbi:MAG: helix-turn-helix transcriptional regulator, partial [Lachnospiraceae bacterium]|nr:helix-turn-helix transcriptional regulator [Lachnospiraceae bacterium]
HILCIFAPDLVREYAVRLAGKIPRDNLFIPDPYFVDALCDLSPDSTTTHKKGILYSLCAQFDQSKSYELRQADSDGLLKKIFAFVEESFVSDCSLKKLAEKTEYDYAYLSRIFRKIVGISYNTYVNHYRLSHACYLMENTDFSIIQCALESGYESVRSFNRNFKAYLGMTPTEYRESHISKT